MLRRYRTLNNDTEVNVDGARLRAGDDGVFVVEAGSRAEDVLIAGGAISAQLFNLLFDDDGNLIANVNHRTGTLASLLALAGGDGEISVATDVDAIVVHNGVALEAKPFYRSTKLGELHLIGTASNLTGGTDLHVELVSKTVDFGGSVVDLANNKFAVPAGTKFVKCFLTVTPSDADVTAGTAFTAFIDYYLQALGNWSSIISDSVLSMSAPMTGTTKTVSMFGFTTSDRSVQLDQNPTADDGYLRIRIGHNDGIDVYSSVSVSAVFEFYGAN